MLIALAVTASLVSPAPANDICVAMVPPRLAALIARDFPEYVLPSQSDARADRLQRIAEQGGWPCPFVAIADFDGDGSLDRAVALKHKNAPANVKIIAARNVDGMWRIEVQKDWPLAITAVVVEPLEAGLYEQTKTGQSSASQLDNLNSIQSDHAGFLTGQEAGAQTAFFYQGNEWQQIWIAE